MVSHGVTWGGHPLHKILFIPWSQSHDVVTLLVLPIPIVITPWINLYFQHAYFCYNSTHKSIANTLCFCTKYRFALVATTTSTLSNIWTHGFAANTYSYHNKWIFVSIHVFTLPHELFGPTELVFVATVKCHLQNDLDSTASNSQGNNKSMSSCLSSTTSNIYVAI